MKVIAPDRTAILAEIERRHAAGESLQSISRTMGKCDGWAAAKLRYRPTGRPQGSKRAAMRTVKRAMSTAEEMAVDALLEAMRSGDGMERRVIDLVGGTK